MSTSQNHYNYRGLVGAVCVFHVCGGYGLTKTTIIIGVWRAVCISCVWRVSASQNHYNYRDLGGVVCAFHVFRGYRPAKTIIIIGVRGRGRQRRRGEISMFFRCAENGPGSASNGRFGPPFLRLKGGGRTKGENRAAPASTPVR